MNRSPATLTLLLTILLLHGLAGSAAALEMEYITYNGFGPISQAFRKLALIFSDTSYGGLLITAAVLGLVSAALAWATKMATGARLVPLVWAAPVLLGIILYLALFVPKGKLTVYDKVLNRFETIGGIPDGVVAVAGILNKLEAGLVEIIDTAGAPGTQYRQAAGGIGFTTLQKALAVDPKIAFAQQSMSQYIKDCVLFEMVRPGTTFSEQRMLYDTDDFLGELSLADNPAIYTVYYEAARPNGQSLTCRDAWSKIFTIYENPALFQDGIKSACGASLFDPSQAAETEACQQLMSATLAQVNSAVDSSPENFIRQAHLAKLIFTVVNNAAPETSTLFTANRQIVGSGFGMAATINEWLPVMRAIMTAVAIGLIPFLALLLPTPLVGKTLSVIVGFFVFLTTWGIADAVLHGAALDYAVESFEEIRQAKLGLYACLTFPEASTKALAMFGIIRSAGIMLASFLTMMLIRFGGHALAMLAGSLQSAVQGAGSRSGELFTPEGKGAALQSQVHASVPLEMANHYGFSPQALAQQWSAVNSIGAAQADQQTIRAAQDQGFLPKNANPWELASTLHAVNRGIGGSSGPASITTGPEGRAIFTTSQEQGANGWNSQTIGDGQGNTLGAFKGGGGHFTTVNGALASATGANFGSNFSNLTQKRLMEEGIHNLSSGTQYQKTLNQIKQDGASHAYARNVGEQISNSEAQKWQEEVANGKAFDAIHDVTARHTLDAYARTHIGGNIPFTKVGAEAGGGYLFQDARSDGKKTTIHISDSEMNAFEQNRQRLRSDAMNEILNKSENINYAKQLAETTNAQEAQGYMRKAQEISSDSASYNIQATTGLIKEFAQNNYGDTTIPNIQKAMDYFNSLATGSLAEQNNLNSIMKDYSDRQLQGLEHKGITQEVAATKTEVENNSAPTKAAATAVGYEAEVKTAHIADSSVRQLQHTPFKPLVEPNREQVTADHEQRDQFIQEKHDRTPLSPLQRFEHRHDPVLGKPMPPSEADLRNIGAPRPLDQPNANVPRGVTIPAIAKTSRTFSEAAGAEPPPPAADSLSALGRPIPNTTVTIPYQTHKATPPTFEQAVAKEQRHPSSPHGIEKAGEQKGRPAKKEEMID